MSKNTLEIWYQYRFNGCDLVIDDEEPIDLEYDEDTKCPYSQLSNYVITEGLKQCDEYGYFYGNMDDLRQKTLNKATELFGDEFNYKFKVGSDS